ncbi:MAG: NAD-dependent DNA ligase LigA [Clostridiales bacterium]|nr:NAD-dependent DNA ligase LigA [Clostridiales bacterium]
MSNQTKALLRIKELTVLLNEAAKAYYQEDREIMPNLTYDALYDELCALEEKTGVRLANSPTASVGFEVLGELVKVPHEYPMLSLDKTKETAKLVSFLLEGEGLLSWKLDGLTIVLTYENGALRQAVTRGNGRIGEDITHNAKRFKNIPVKISFTGKLVLRGEAVISYSDFDQINADIPAEEKYKNPRNLTSGTVRQLNSEIAAKRNVTFFAFSLVHAAGQDFDDLKSGELTFLKSLGFDVVDNVTVTSETVEDAVKAFSEKIGGNDFASDGLVLTYNSISFSKSLGTTSKFPKDAIAFKWADEAAETTLVAIEWQTSRTGLMNPVAVFEPVALEGTTVSRASVHNVSVLESLALGLGDRISVYKANMIIPQIAENFTRSGTAEIPAQCPVCGAETEVAGENEAKALYCTNPNCKAQTVRSLTHFASRDAMNIDGFSIQTIEKFVASGFLSDYTDIYALSQFSEEIRHMEGFGERSYQKMTAAIEKSKTADLFAFIYALGIHQVGLSGAKQLCAHFENDIQKIKSAEIDDLVAIEGFGQVTAEVIYKYFHNEENLRLLDKVLPLLRIKAPDPAAAAEAQTLKGMTFVVTGDVNLFKNRKELTEKIESLGGKATSSVTGKTSYLINNDVHSPSSKNKKAAELGVPVIDEAAFVNRFLGGSL